MKRNVLVIVLSVMVVGIFLFSCSTKNNPGEPSALKSIQCATHVPTATPGHGRYTGGSVWTEATSAAAFGARTQFPALVFQDKMWVVSGSDAETRYNDSWSSTDGIIWTPVNTNTAFPGRYGHSGAVFTNPAGVMPGIEKMWIIGGYNGSYLSDVWYSADGYTWEAATTNAEFGLRAEQSTVVFNNKLWVIAGGLDGDIRQNDVYSSEDGTVWNLVTSDAGFAKRKQQTCVVFNNMIWIIGGISDTDTLLNDVWCSADGATWTRATANAAFSPRFGHSSVVYDDKMWVMGGSIDGGSRVNDTWYSTNGIDWTKVKKGKPYSLRSWQGSTVYNGKMWVIAGIYEDYLKSVWWSE